MGSHLGLGPQRSHGSSLRNHGLLTLIVLGYLLVPWRTNTGSNHGETTALTHGPVVGAVTFQAATVFVCTDGEAEVAIRYSPDPNLLGYQETPAVLSEAGKQFATQIRLADLMPSTTYYLDVVVAGQPQLASPYPQFKTFPALGSATPFRFVILTDFKSANSGQVNPVATFVNASQELPDFVYIGGDFDHRNPTTVAEKTQMFKDLYTPANNYEDFVFEILRKFAVVHNWDDHDFGANSADKTYAHRRRSLIILQSFFPVYPLTKYGDWQSFSYGQADFFLLDARAQRDVISDPDGPDKSMLDGDNLGADGQLEWLKNGLLASTATWKFILTPVVFNPTNPSDAWSGYLYERGQIVDFITTNNISGVIFISGDRHAGAIDDGTNSDFPEMLVPSVNLNRCPTAGTLGVWSQGTYQADASGYCRGYGVVTVSTNPDQVLLEVKDDTGGLRLSYLVTAP